MLSKATWWLFALSQLLFLALFSLRGSQRTRLSVGSETVSLLCTVGLASVSGLEHTRSIKPSALLQTFLFYSTVTGAVRVRTEWLRASWLVHHEADGAIDALRPYAATTIWVLDLVLLVLESLPKRKHRLGGAASLKDVSPEEEAGIFSRSLLLWVGSLLKVGYRKDLMLDDLFPLDPDLTSSVVYDKLATRWEKSKPPGLAVGRR